MLGILLKIRQSGARTVTLLVCAALLLADSAWAQGAGVIEGYVRDRQGAPRADVVVVLKGGAGIQVDRTHTNSEGHYAFYQIGAGIFFVTLEIKGAPGESRRVEFLPNEAGGHRREDFSLEPAIETRPTLPTEPVFVQQVPPEAVRWFEQAQEQLRTGKADAAIESLEQAVKQFPAYYEAWNALGMEYLKRSDVRKTAAAFQRALAVNRNSAGARFGMGWAYYQAEKLNDAARELNEAVKLNPRVAESHWYLGMTQMERRQWASAEQAFEAFGKLNTRDDRPLLHLYMTSVNDALGRRAAAVASLEAYLKAVPEKDRTPKLRELLEQLKRKRDSATAKNLL